MSGGQPVVDHCCNTEAAVLVVCVESEHHRSYQLLTEIIKHLIFVKVSRLVSGTSFV